MSYTWFEVAMSDRGNHETRSLGMISLPRRTSIFVGLACMMALLPGCQGAIVGNLVVLGITVGIFYGTLSLGRTTPDKGGAEASTSTHGHS